MTLAPLDESARSKLRSGVALTCLAQCVTELVDNAVDAGASCIAVRVDMSRFKVQVVDNGKGISQTDFDLIGQRYVTSKCHTLEDLDTNLQHLGYRGEALASIIDVTRMVEISSRHHLSPNTYNKVFLSGKLVGLAAAQSQRPSVGTTVTLHDLFHNMPVRRRAMVEVFELEQVRKAVECIALVNPPVSFSVRNEVTGLFLLQTHKTRSVLSNFAQLFSSSKIGTMRDVNVSHSKFTVSGFISTEPHHSNSLQFIYVNRRIVRKTPLHTCVNGQLGNSLLVKKPKQQGHSLALSKKTVSPTRAVERHPVYVLMVECSRCEYDVCLEPAKTLVEFKHWDSILTALITLTNKFLLQNHLYPGLVSARTAVQSTDAVTGSLKDSSPLVQSVKRSKLSATKLVTDQSSHNYSASEIPACHNLSTRGQYSSSTPIDNSSHQHPPPNYPSSCSTSLTHISHQPLTTYPTTVCYNPPQPLSSQHSTPHSKCSVRDSQCLTITSSQSSKPLWKEILDPATGHSIFVHSVTGNSSYSNPSPAIPSSATSVSYCSGSEHKTLSNHQSALESKHLRLTPHSVLPPVPAAGPVSQLSEVSLHSKWRSSDELAETRREKRATSFETLLKNWRNPTFQSGEQGVLDIGCGVGSGNQLRVHSLVNKCIFTKHMFSDVQVLGQVDHKFIACLMRKERSTGRMLVMVDQHAAHERVRLESLQGNLYENDPLPGGRSRVKASNIQPPIALVLSPSQLELAKHFKHQLQLIGVSSTVDGEGRLLVHSLPSVLVEREVSEVRRGRPAVAIALLQEMIVTHLELLAATGGGCKTTPAAITHLLNSHACHGAVKFGDPLTEGECEGLIQLLAQCKLPFQCAHGRPSLVPIIDLESLNRSYPPPQVMPFPQINTLKLKYSLAD